MSKIQEIVRAIERLSPDDLAAFRNWFSSYDADAWDRQIVSDAAAGGLDALAEESLADLRAGRCTEL